MPGVQQLDVSKVGQALVVSTQNKQLDGTLQPVSPLMQSQNHSKQLCYPHHSLPPLEKAAD